MFISKLIIENFKSFRVSEEIKFTQGFNIVVGRNNAGKTALIEALSLQFQNKPHRSGETVPTALSIPEKTSSARITFGVDLSEAIEAYVHFKSVIVPLGNNETLANGHKRFYQYFQRAFEVSGKYQPHGFLEPWLVNFGPMDGHTVFFTEHDLGSKSFNVSQRHSNTNVSMLAVRILNNFRERIYLFRAERLNIGECNSGTNSILASDASNLAEVLILLQSRNPARYDRFINDVRTVFPDICDISIIPVENHRVRINVWFVEPATERADLTVPLADCGTGVGQALAILYVVLNSDQPLTILIDEPQSFLHPGAIRKLFEILKRYPRHQYIVTTHSPTAVTAANPRTLILLKRENLETKIEAINVGETNELRTFLSDVGARLSDVFGADNILWVEGRTEEICFQIIVERLLKLELFGTDIIGVKQVGDLEGRHAKTVLEIYKRLCQGKGLLPPAIGFCFDREGRNESERLEMTANSGGKIQFIPRRMFENFLLNPRAIAAILTKADEQHGAKYDEKTVADWFAGKGHGKPYVDTKLPGEWEKTVDAAKLLNDLFNDLSEARICFDKTNHSVKLIEWLIEKEASWLDELVVFLKSILSKQTS